LREIEGEEVSLRLWISCFHSELDKDAGPRRDLKSSACRKFWEFWSNSWKRRDIMWLDGAVMWAVRNSE